jgi:very-short-patch-repair endonuclease
MNLINLKLVEESTKKYHKKIYVIDQDNYYINDKNFKIKKSLSNLSKYLNLINVNLIDIFKINHDCKNCGKPTKISFSRNKLTVYTFCSTKCQQYYKKQQIISLCPICEKGIIKKDKKKEYYGTCGNNDCIKEHKRKRKENIKNNHWVNKKDSSEIQKQRIKTRKINDRKLNRKYIPWNKDKTNIYSKETIEKIRKSTIKQLKEGKFKKTKIEEKIESFLINQEINYTYSFILNQRQYDFYLKDYKILIEADGDYWHGNPNIYNILSERQLLKQADDKIKNRIARENGFELLRFWESDINNNFNLIKNKINEKINEKKLF